MVARYRPTANASRRRRRPGHEYGAGFSPTVGPSRLLIRVDVKRLGKIQRGAIQGPLRGVRQPRRAAKGLIHTSV